MEKELHITVNGRPAYGMMVKYRFENEAKKLSGKLMDGIMPRIDELFTNH